MSPKKSSAKPSVPAVPPAVDAPCEVLAAPGLDEAARINRLYADVLAGCTKVVALGAAACDVRERLPRGKFADWIVRYCGAPKRRTIYNACQIAQYVREQVCSALHTSDLPFSDLASACDAPLSAEEIAIFGAVRQIAEGSSQRQMLARIREERTDDAEAKARATCERLWKSDPLLRDEWEPIVLGGELDYCTALRAMSGQLATKGKRRAAANYQLLLPKVFGTACRGFARWADLDVETRAEVAAGARELARNAPPEVRAALLDELSPLRRP